MTILFFSIIILCFSLNTYQRNGVWGEGTALWSDCVLKSPNRARPHHNLGYAYGKKGNSDKAIEEYKRALAINPIYVGSHSNLGAAYGKKGKLDEAISELKKAIAINPNNTDAHNNLGNAYAKKGRLDEAISEFKKAINIKPNYAEAYYKLGSALEVKCRISDAISAYREAIQLKPDYEPAYNNLAWIYATFPNATIRNGDEAVILATKACELTGFKKAEELDTLAAAYAEKGNFEKAVEYQHRAIELAPSQIERELQKHLQLYQSGQVYREQ